MTIQLDKILEDISGEKSLYVREAATAEEEQAAWGRVGAKNKLSGVEIKAIFKVLQKKYSQEKDKPNSSWKLFAMMKKISEKEEAEETADEEEEENAEDEAFIELLEVREEEEASDEDHDKSGNSNSTKAESPEKTAPAAAPVTATKTSPRLKAAAAAAAPTPPTAKKDVKILNNQISLKTEESVKTENSPPAVGRPKVLRSAVNVKQTTLTPTMTRKPLVGQKEPLKVQQSQTPQQKKVTPVDNRRVLNQEVLKRKLSDGKKDDHSSLPSKRPVVKAQPLPPIGTVVNTGSLSAGTVSVVSVVPCATAKPLIDEQTKFINGSIAINTPNGRVKTENGLETDELANFGNFDNSLPPEFFKNLCNSKRHESMGLYVANVLNRCTPKAAKKLELAILKSIIEFQSEELDNN